MKISQIVTEARTGTLYHSLSGNNFIHSIKHDKLFATVVHYMQNDGSPAPMLDFYAYGYEDDLDIHEFAFLLLNGDGLSEEERDEIISFLENTSPAAGISLTRSKKFAEKWAFHGVILELDANLLSNNFKLIPIDYLAFDSKSKRSEAEEFLIVSKKYNDIRKLIDNLYRPVTELSIQNLDRYIVKIHISSKSLPNDENFMSFVNKKFQNRITFF